MSSRLEWKLGELTCGRLISVSFVVKEPVGRGDFIVGVDVADADEFIASSSGWVYSTKLRVPFVYIPATESYPVLWKLPKIDISNKNSQAALFVKRWRSAARPCESVFEAALFSVRTSRGNCRTYMVPGEVS